MPQIVGHQTALRLMACAEPVVGPGLVHVGVADRVAENVPMHHHQDQRSERETPTLKLAVSLLRCSRGRLGCSTLSSRAPNSLLGTPPADKGGDWLGRGERGE